MLALLFPGQGSQRPGMGAPWREHPSWELVGRLSDATGTDLAALLLDADAETLRVTANAQPATFASSLVILDAVRRAGLVDDGAVVAVAGHSLGEYAALVAAGVLGETQAATLVSERAGAMQEAAAACPGTMAAVLGLDADRLRDACASVPGAWVANDNAPGQIVVAGTADGVAAAGEAARAAGAKRVLPLPVGGAFHSPLMAGAQDRLDRAIAATPFAAATVPVVTNLDASAHTDGFAPLLSGQLVAPVRWRESLLCLDALGATTLVELGAGTELSGMVRRTLPDARRANVATPADLEALGALLGA